MSEQRADYRVEEADPAAIQAAIEYYASAVAEREVWKSMEDGLRSAVQAAYVAEVTKEAAAARTALYQLLRIAEEAAL